MPRPLKISADTTARDVATLTRVLQRVTREEGRDPEEKEKIAGSLRVAIAGLVRWTEPEDATRAVNGRKEKSGSSKDRNGLRAER